MAIEQPLVQRDGVVGFEAITNGGKLLQQPFFKSPVGIRVRLMPTYQISQVLPKRYTACRLFTIRGDVRQSIQRLSGHIGAIAKHPIKNPRPSLGRICRSLDDESRDAMSIIGNLPMNFLS